MYVTVRTGKDVSQRHSVVCTHSRNYHVLSLLSDALVRGKKPQRDESPGKRRPEFSKTIHGGPAHRHREVRKHHRDTRLRARA